MLDLGRSGPFHRLHAMSSWHQGSLRSGRLPVLPAHHTGNCRAPTRVHTYSRHTLIQGTHIGATARPALPAVRKHAAALIMFIYSVRCLRCLCCLRACLRLQGIEATRELAQSTNAKTVIFGNPSDGLPVIMGGLQPRTPAQTTSGSGLW